MSIRLMTAVWDDTRFKGTELLVLLCLADHANDEGICWPSYARLAERSRCSRRQAIRAVKSLKDEGWITIVGQRPVTDKHFTNVFRLTLPKTTGDVVSPVKPISPSTGDICALTGDTVGKELVTPMSPKPSYESPIEASVARRGRARTNFPEIEEVQEHVLSCTGLNEIHAVMCAEKWLDSADPEKMTEWKASVEAFSEKYERDYRQ